MLGHVLSPYALELVRKVTCHSELQKPGVGYRSVGQPKQNWVIENLTKASNRIIPSEETYEHAQTLPNLAILEAAIQEDV